MGRKYSEMKRCRVHSNRETGCVRGQRKRGGNRERQRLRDHQTEGQGHRDGHGDGQRWVGEGHKEPEEMQGVVLSTTQR